MRNHYGIHDDGAGGLQFGNGFVEDAGNNFEVRRLRFTEISHWLAQDADARALQAVRVQKLGVGLRNLCPTPSAVSGLSGS